MKVLITGGAGYIGTELVRKLTLNPNIKEIVIYDNLSRGNYNFFVGRPLDNREKVKFVQGELLDSQHLKRILDGVSAVYHLAAKVTTPFANTDPHFYEQVNHWGTAELVYAVEESKVEKFIFTSTVSVYGASKELITINTVPNPKTFYGISKLRGEEHVDRLKSKLKTYILRCGNVYGYSPSMRFDAVLNKFVFESHYKRRISIQGTGQQTRAFIGINVLSDALVDILTHDMPSGTYNLTSANYKVIELVDILKELIPDLEFSFVNQHMNLREITVEEDKRLRDWIDLSPIKTLKEEIRELINSFAF